MNIKDINNFSMKKISEYNLPIYIFGSWKDSLPRLLNYLSEYNLECKALFIEEAPPKKANYSNILSIYCGLGINVDYPPVDAASLPKGVIICASELYEKRKWLNFFSKDNKHIVIDVHDLFCYTSYIKCSKYFYDNNNLLSRCRSCSASYRDCPIREQFYKQKGISRKKAIQRLLLRCSFMCNYKCEGCSQFLPYYQKHHKRNFNGAEIISDLQKIASSLQYINDLWLEGGEAMLWKPLPELVNEALKLDNIGKIFILTNGSYIPQKKLLNILAENRERIYIDINSYSTNNNINNLMNELDKYKISFCLRNEIAEWTDFRDTSFKKRSITELQNIGRKCGFFKRNFDQWILTDGKLSAYCCEAGYLHHYLNLYDKYQNDYIKIRELSTESIPIAMEQLYDRRYLDVCNHCTGDFSENSVKIKPAKQIEEYNNTELYKKK